MLRRHLGVEPEDVPSLPWWKRKLYVEGLLWEFSNQEDDDIIEGTPDNLADLGFTTSSHTIEGA